MAHRARVHPRAIALRVAPALAGMVAAGACGFDFTLGYNPPPPPPSDLAIVADAWFVFPSLDLPEWNPTDLSLTFPCLEGQPDCGVARYGPPGGRFALQSDPMKDPLERDSGVDRDVNGYLQRESPQSPFSYLWVPNTRDLGDAGTVSKLDVKTVREVARYPSVTCYSLKTGGKGPCDGYNGCCSGDDWPRYQARRKIGMPEPGHQPVQVSGNFPSRTSVDFNGDLFVANEALGGRASLTRIANDISQCVDRNRSGRIDTSSDTNGDGSIVVDCNGDGQPDDLASVKGKPCSSNLKQEYYGADDECVLWTTNLFAPLDARARAVGLGSDDNGLSLAWVGSFTQGIFVAVDGITGKQKQQAQLPADCWGNGNGPNGATVDASGIAWVPQQGAGKLCYFDIKRPMNVGVVRDPQWGPMEADGVALDRDQNIWVGRSVARYTPDRSNGFANLGHGWWTRMDGVTGTRIVSDSRNANAYFVYSCLGNGVLQIPASTIKVMKADRTEPNPGWPVIQMPCLGVSVDVDQNVWGLDAQLSTRAFVDKLGAIVQPKVNGPPMGNNKCPAGDSCAAHAADPYSDMAGFGLRNGTIPHATYQMLVPGCHGRVTDWQTIEWDADVPPNTGLVVRARTGNHAPNDPAWGGAAWTPDFAVSPAVLRGVLSPNWSPQEMPDVLMNGWLMVEFIFKANARNATPKLKSFQVRYRCPTG